MRSSYIESCACNGARPAALGGSGFFYRNGLLASMIGHRDLVRYLVAPTCFGKTTLAGSYADAVFDCYDTFWIDGGSVSFIRDLDDGTLARDLPRMVASGGLAVIDDLPQLGEERAARLWEVCRTVLGAGSEVVLTSTPGCDPMAAYRGECLALGPLDLLYGDDDFDALHRLDVSTRRLRPPSCAADRIAGLARRDAASYERFLAAAIADGTAEENLLTFALLALESGPVADVAAVLGSKVRAADLAPDTVRPYVHVDFPNDAFLAKGFPLAAVARAFAPYLQAIARGGAGLSPDELVGRLADRLVVRGGAERAVRLMTLSCGAGARAEWLRAHQDELADRGALVACEVLYRSLRECAGASSSDLAAGSALRRALMGDPSALADLSAIARCSANAPAVRLKAAAAAAVIGGPGAQAPIEPSEGMRALEAWVPAELTGDEARALLAFLLHAGDADGGISALEALSPSTASGASAWGLAWALTEAGAGCDRARLLGLVRDVLQRAGAEGAGSLPSCLLYRSAKRRFPREELPFEKRWESAWGAIQRQKLQYMKAMGARRASAAAGPAAPAVLGAKAQEYAVPPLQVNLFGSFEVRIGGRPVSGELFGRTKARALCAVLVAHAGHQLSTRLLAESMWPASCEEKARHNLNSVLSLLRRALTLPSGACPYLYRNQGVVMLQGDLVESDRARLLDLCRALQCEAMPPDDAVEAFEELRAIFSGGLLPGDSTTGVVVRARKDWRDRVVSACVHASRQMEEQGACRDGLAMASQALAWDAEREDCYSAVMRLQALCDQRPQAVETWSCYLDAMDRYGLGPSPAVKRLYESILDGSFQEQERARAAKGKGARAEGCFRQPSGPRRQPRGDGAAAGAQRHPSVYFVCS